MVDWSVWLRCFVAVIGAVSIGALLGLIGAWAQAHQYRSGWGE